MKKIYSLLLTAAALLVGTNAWAVDVANLAELQEAILTPNAEINLTAAIGLPDPGEYDFNGATIICGNDKEKDYRLNASAVDGVYTFRNVTFKNYKYSSPKGAIYTTKAGTGITLNIESSVYFEGNSYDIDVYNNSVTVNNAATINKITLQRGGTVNNDGVIVAGVFGKGSAAGATTINNNAGATLTQTLGFAYGVTINNEGTAKVSGGTASANMTANNVVISGGTRNKKLIGTDVTINGGTFKGEISGTGYTITSGTFNVAPAAGTSGLIQPTEYGYAKFLEGVGSLEIASGFNYRAYDNMIVRNDAGQVEVTHADNSTVTCLIEEAFANAANGDVITLLEDVISYGNLWLGTAAKTGAFKSVTLDLNGHTLYSAKNVTRTITLTHGALYIVNSVPGQGGISHMRSNASGKSSEIIYIVGSPDRNAINPRNAAVQDLFVYLLVDEGVTLSAEGNFVNGITVIENQDGGNQVSQLEYFTNIYKDANAAFSVANGVRIDVKGTVNVTKYAGKINGNIRHPNELIVDYPGVTDAQIGDTANSTFFHIFPTAIMHTSDSEEATAVYSSGYARWLIQGLCQGATGVYVKSGVIDLTDAIIESTWTGDANITTGLGSGVKAGGNAVVIESNDHYTGQQALVIGGDTKISTEANGGAAVVDIVDETHDSKVESIVINGGSFTGDNAIVISSETASEQVTTVNGVTVVGEITVGGSSDPADVADIMGSNTHTTEIENPDGTTTVIISAGSAPSAATEWVDVAAMQEGSNANWTGFTAGTIANGEKVSLGELQVISGTKVGETEKYQVLTIEDGGVLEVERLILSDSARIIVEAGGQLIVTGTQGINAPNVANITLRTQENKPSIFLLNPAVSSNRNPHATVEFISKSCYRKPAKENIFQRFGIPMTKNGLESIECAGNHETRFYVFNYAQNKWDGIGYINPSAGYEDQPLDYTRLNDPFEYYQLLDFDVTTPSNVVYTMKGNLLGNSEPVMKIFENSWKGFANSYMGKMQLSELLALIPNTVDKAIYTYNVNAAFASWEPVSNLNVEGKMLNPMQPFLIRNRYAAAEVALDYEATVYNPTMGIVPNGAPSRGTANDFTMATITIANEINSDYVIVAEDAQFSAEFDNGYDASKFMNDEINLYVEADENMSIFATDNLENTTLGVSSVLGGKYTITFSNVKGDNFVLVDNLTGAQAAMVEGNSYEFEMEANTVNSHRFAIVPAAKMPTALENAEVKANVKGVYTLIGQYVGEKIDELPAGVYVVDGVKVVK